MAATTDPTKLAAPGAGLPFFQKVMLRYLFVPRYVNGRDWGAHGEKFRREGAKMLALLRQNSPEKLAQRALIRPLAGLEDSSRYWSLAMVAEHLIIVGTLMADVIVDLSRGEVPSGVADTAKLKPGARLSPGEAAGTFAAFLDAFEGRMSEVVHPPAKARFAHPWFGPLDAPAWHAVAGLHQALHRRQSELILERAQRT